MTDKFAPKQNFEIQVDNLLLNLFVGTKVNVADTRLTASLHRHSYAEIFVCKSGEIQIKTENQNYHLFPGDVAIAPSGIMHLRTPNFSVASEWTSIGIVFSQCASQSNRDVYARISRLMEQNEIVVYNGQEFLYDILCGIRDSADPDSEPFRLLDFASVLVNLSQTIPSRDTVTNSNQKSKNKNMDRLLKLDYFINHEFMNPLTNKKIADELHIGERQLSRFVLTHYGTTLHTLLLSKRISVAAKLLSESIDTIDNIALAVGFNSKMNFYREFKKVYQVTPAQYRNAASDKA